MNAFHRVGRLAIVLRMAVLASVVPLAVRAADTNIIAWPSGSVTNVPDLPTNAIAVTGGDLHGVALLADRTLVSWGKFALGQLEPRPNVTEVVGIAAGSSHTIAARRDGSVTFWGRFIGSAATNVPPEATNVVAVGAGPGAQHALVLRADGSVLDWGLPATTNVPPGVLNIVAVAAGAKHSLALRSDGRVLAWGENSSGVTDVPANATNIVAIATTWYGNIALRADGTLLTWGTDPNIPSQTTLTDVMEVAGAGVGGGAPGGGIALRRDGRVFASGAPASTTNIMAIGGSGSAFMAVRAAGPPIFPHSAVRRTVAAGQTAYLRLCAVGALPVGYQWSYQGTNLPGATREVLIVTNALPDRAGLYSLVASNALGTLTNSEMELVVVPFVITNQPASQVTYVGANPKLNVGVLGYSPLYQWSFNGTNIPWGTSSSLTLTNIQLADAGSYSVTVSNSYGAVTSSNAMIEVQPILLTQSPMDQVIFPGGTASLSISAQAGPPLYYQWQFNGINLTDATSSVLTLTNIQYDQAGLYSVIASTTNAVLTNSATLSVVPVATWGRDSSGSTAVPNDLTNVIGIAAGGSHSVALKTDGAVVVWGGDSLKRRVPADLTNAVAISAGGWGTLALRADGTVAAWGSSTTVITNVPPALTNAVALAAGAGHSLALKSDGTVVAWGSNSSGQTNVPSGLTDVVAVAAGDYTSMALKASGEVVVWGDNGNGQTNVPAALSNAVAIAAGYVLCAAAKSDGGIAVWGSSSYGIPSIPVSATNIVAVDAGYGNCLALRDDGTVIAWGYSTDGQTTLPTGLQNVMAIASGRNHCLALVGGLPDTAQVSVMNPSWNGSRFSFGVPTRKGRVYRLEYKDNLSDSTWTGLALVAGNDTTLTLSDSGAPASQRFYRVRRW